MKRPLLLAALVGVVALGAIAAPSALSYIERQRLIAEQENVELPDVEKPSSSASSVIATSSSTAAVASSTASLTPPPSSASVRAAVNLGVPFTSQAPTGNWNATFKEACEEASVLMAIKYFRGEDFGSATDAEAEVAAMVQANTDSGFAIDDTAAEVVTLLRSQAPELSATLLQNPTVDQIKTEISAGKLIIVPAQGQFLGNPYFTAPGPRYHMLVLRGYTDDGYVITNDPGTKRGEQYVYKWETMMNAIHDWNGGDVENGAKVVIVVGD